MNKVKLSQLSDKVEYKMQECKTCVEKSSLLARYTKTE